MSHPTFTVRDRGEVLTIEIVAGSLVITTPTSRSWVAHSAETQREIYDKLAQALALLGVGAGGTGGRADR